MCIGLDEFSAAGNAYLGNTLYCLWRFPGLVEEVKALWHYRSGIRVNCPWIMLSVLPCFVLATAGIVLYLSSRRVGCVPALMTVMDFRRADHAGRRPIHANSRFIVTFSSYFF